MNISDKPLSSSKPYNIAIAVSDFNKDLTHQMLEIASKRIKESGSQIKKIIHVPGSYDIPLAVKHLLKRNDIDGVITLGIVIHGATSHDKIVAENAAKKITDLSIEFEKPVSLGIAGPKMSRKAALERYKKYAIRAADAVIKLLNELKQ